MTFCARGYVTEDIILDWTHDCTHDCESTHDCILECESYSTAHVLNILQEGNTYMFRALLALRRLLNST